MALKKLKVAEKSKINNKYKKCLKFIPKYSTIGMSKKDIPFT